MDITTVKLTEDGYVVNGSIYVPDDPANRHYQEIQVWIGEGNTPDPADVIPPPPVLTDLEKLEQGTGLSLAEIKAVLGV